MGIYFVIIEDEDMRFIHTADLHIGKQVNEFSMLDDQQYILNQIVEICREKKAEAIVLAGDIYDRAMPGADAVEVFDRFLTNLTALGLQVMIISGNHDSAQRLSYGEAIFEKHGVHIGAVQDSSIKKVMLTDEYGEVCFTLLPFVKPAMIGATTMDEAVGTILEHNASPSSAMRNVMVAHYFVANAGCEPELSDSESGIYVGGLDLVNAKHFRDYDYVALGHIHKPQRLLESNIYYAGSPLKYSFLEAAQTKSVRLVELKEKGNVMVEEIKLVPKRELRCIKGRLSELVREDIVSLSDREDYIQVTLTDEEEFVDAFAGLRSVYPNTMQLWLERDIAAKDKAEPESTDVTDKDDETLFKEFYEAVTDRTLSGEKQKIVAEAFCKIREELA
jgi:exonuclease SbcD